MLTSAKQFLCPCISFIIDYKCAKFHRYSIGQSKVMEGAFPQAFIGVPKGRNRVKVPQLCLKYF